MIPTSAMVDLGGNRGVFMATDGEQGQVASFKKISTGIVNQDLAEVTSGLSEGETIITTGAGALREGDRILLPGQTAGPAGAAGGRGRGRGGAGSAGGSGGQGRGRGEGGQQRPRGGDQGTGQGNPTGTPRS